MNFKNVTFFILAVCILTNTAVTMSFASNLVVEPANDTGIKITSDNKSILINALSSDGKLQSNKAMFEQLATNTDIVLTTNANTSHFSPKLATRLMLSNPDTILVGTPKTIHRMHDMFGKHRMISPRLNSAQHHYQGVDITTIDASLRHEVGQTTDRNYVFLIKIGHFNVLHIGDALIDDSLANAEGNKTAQIDLAIVPEHCVHHKPCTNYLNEMGVKHIALTHTPQNKAEKMNAKIQSEFPHIESLTDLNKRFELVYESQIIDNAMSAAVVSRR
jgi:hypothetical protein